MHALPIGWIDLILILIATYRVSSTFVDESFPPFVAIREWLHPRLPEKWQTLVECPWCISMWFGVAITGFWWLATDPYGRLHHGDGAWSWLVVPYYLIVIGLCASAVTGNLHDREPGFDPDA